MLEFIVPEDGSIENQEQQYEMIKKNSNVLLPMAFYQDRLHALPWDLSDATILNFLAKVSEHEDEYVINKDVSSPDWDLTDADDGILGMVLKAITATITGDRSTFTGSAGDKIKVVVDRVIYDNIDVSACTSIDGVVNVINAAVGADVALKVVATGFLQIASPTFGVDSYVLIGDGTLTTHTVVARLFSTSNSRVQDGYYSDLATAQSLFCEIEFQPNGSDRIYRTQTFILDVKESL